MQRDVLTVLETASTLNLHPETVKRFCRIGKLHGEKVNGGWLISKTEVESFVSTYKETRGRPVNGRAQRNGGSG
jgi:excisionase family DNA binding protein